jgi:hypothetical protein
MIFTYVDKVDGAGNTISAAHINALQDQKLDAYDAGAYASFAAAVAAMGATAGRLWVTSSMAVAANVSIPATLEICIPKGGELAIANGVTVTFNGLPPNAGLYKIFTCTGTGKVVFGAGAWREVYPQWWGVVAGGDAGDNSDAMDRVVATAKINGLTVFFPDGTYALETYMPIRQETVVSIEDFHGLTISGTGKNSIIETTHPTDGCDVFQLNGVSNVVIKNVGVHSHLPGGATSGSNAFSFTNGAKNIRVENAYVYVMPYVTGATINGGSAFTIQHVGALEHSGIIVRNCEAEGGSHGFTYDATDMANGGAITAHGIICSGNKFKNFYMGVKLSTSLTYGGAAPGVLVGQDFKVTGNTIIDCQQGISDWGMTGAIIEGNHVLSTLATAVDPAMSAAWLAGDTELYGAKIGSAHRSNFSNNIIYEYACTSFIKLLGGNWAEATTPADNLTVIGNTAYGTASGYGIDFSGAAYGGVTNSRLIGNAVIGYTGSAYDPEFFDPTYNNTVVEDFSPIAWTPTVTASAGTLTTITATGKYVKTGKFVTASFSIVITDKGNASGELYVTLPFSAASSFNWAGTGRETNATGVALSANIHPANPARVTVVKYDNSTVIGNANTVIVTINYWCA